MDRVYSVKGASVSKQDFVEIPARMASAVLG